MTGAAIRPGLCIAVLAHNEQARIAACLASIAADAPGAEVHVIVNGSRDATAAIARAHAAEHPHTHVHDWADGGKARSWNRFLFETLDRVHDTHVFVDGDAVVVPGSCAALAAALAADAHANAASAMPANGRRRDAYRDQMRRERGLFGDLYALPGRFVARLRDADVRLPVDTIGDDGLIGALAKIDLGTLADWDDRRVVPVEDAGFLCEPVRLVHPSSWIMQYRRMVNYSQRHFQNAIITGILRNGGATGLPERLAAHRGAAAVPLVPRRALPWAWFDRRALARMARQA